VKSNVGKKVEVAQKSHGVHDLDNHDLEGVRRLEGTTLGGKIKGDFLNKRMALRAGTDGEELARMQKKLGLEDDPPEGADPEHADAARGRRSEYTSPRGRVPSPPRQRHRFEPPIPSRYCNDGNKGLKSIPTTYQRIAMGEMGKVFELIMFGKARLAIIEWRRHNQQDRILRCQRSLNDKIHRFNWSTNSFPKRGPKLRPGLEGHHGYPIAAGWSQGEVPRLRHGTTTPTMEFLTNVVEDHRQENRRLRLLLQDKEVQLLEAQSQLARKDAVIIALRKGAGEADEEQEQGIRDIYEEHNREKLDDLPRLLAKSRSGEGLGVLLERLKVKYVYNQAKLPKSSPRTHSSAGSSRDSDG